MDPSQYCVGDTMEMDQNFFKYWEVEKVPRYPPDTHPH